MMWLLKVEKVFEETETPLPLGKLENMSESELLDSAVK